jgi:hypothetical protein
MATNLWLVTGMGDVFALGYFGYIVVNGVFVLVVGVFAFSKVSFPLWP